MVAPRDLTADYYEALQPGSVELAGSAKPENGDALQARKRAMREGRLIVLDALEQDDHPDCTGCSATPPRAALGLASTVGDPVPTPTPPSSTGDAWTSGADKADGRYFDPGTMPRILQADQTAPGQAGAYFAELLTPQSDDKPGEIRRRPRRRLWRLEGDSIVSTVELLLEGFKVSSGAGTCAPSGGDCVEQTPCRFLVEVKLRAKKTGPDAWPDISVDIPGVGVAVAQRTDEATVGNDQFALYTYQFTWSVACGAAATRMLNLNPESGGANVTPTTDGWEDSNLTDTQAVVWVEMLCDKCRGQN